MSRLPKCNWCGERTATCIGSYEHSDNELLPACDVCCGHGCEDGQCFWLSEEKPEPCVHEWVDARNEVITDGEWCRKCNAIRTGGTEPLTEEEIEFGRKLMSGEVEH